MNYIYGLAASVKPDELHLRLKEPSVGRLELATITLRPDGAAAFVKGDGPIETIVLPRDPTLDDMLAATFLERRLRNEELPVGAAAFAAYAANVREGFVPSSLSAEDSLAGTYLAVRNEAGADLTEAAASQKLSARWAIMARKILQAAAEGKDPVRDPLLSADADFARARAYLAEDRATYYQRDVPAGARWTVQLTKPSPRVAGLLLRSPHSILWKHWARQDPEAPGGRGYYFLAVYETERAWRFSTPAGPRGVSLAGLAEQLQRAEAARNPERAARAAEEPPESASQRWFDGKRFDHTIIGAPSEGGTELSDAEVLRIVKRWADVRSADPSIRTRRAILAAALGLLLLVPVGLGARYLIGWSAPPPPPPPKPPPAPLFVVRAEVNGKPVQPGTPLAVEDNRDAGRFAAQFDALLREDGNDIVVTLEAGRLALPFRVVARVQGERKLPVKDLRLQVNDQANPKPIAEPGAPNVISDTADVAFKQGENRVVLDVKNLADQPVPVKVRLEWSVNWSFQRKLYLVTAGINTYADPSIPKLDCPVSDSRALAKALEAQAGKDKLFADVLVEPSVDQQVLWKGPSGLAAKLDWLRKSVATDPHSLAVVSLSGHGGLAPGGFYFWPHDYDPRQPVATGISWDSIQNQLQDLPCPVLVVLDACHSGGAEISHGIRGADPSGQLVKALASPLQRAAGGRNVLVVVAACRANDVAQEDEKTWGHGALMLAILEALKGERLYTARGKTPLPRQRSSFARPVITLQELCSYADERVNELTGGNQAVTVRTTDETLLGLIPLAQVRSQGAPTR
jgi:hypothetical protein